MRLAPVLDLNEATPLLQEMLEKRGGDLTLDGSDVQRLGVHCLQILLAAQHAWAAAGHRLQIENGSDNLLLAFEILGVKEKALDYRGG
jgi:chemotaxis protein CheX